MRFAGGYGVTVECGQHLDPNGPQVGYDVVINGMAALGMIDAALPETQTPLVLEITEAILADHDEDKMIRRFVTGEQIKQGEIIGKRHDGRDIIMPYDGAIIFAGISVPMHHEMCFLCKTSDRLQD